MSIVFLAAEAVFQAVLVVLKLCGLIDCVWGWVLAPLWMNATASAVFFIVLVFVPWLKEHLHGKD